RRGSSAPPVASPSYRTSRQRRHRDPPRALRRPRRERYGLDARSMAQESPLKVAIYTSAWTVLVVLLAQFLSARWHVRSEIQVSDHQRRQQLYSQLVGQRTTITKLHQAYLNALIGEEFRNLR